MKIPEDRIFSTNAVRTSGLTLLIHLIRPVMTGAASSNPQPHNEHTKLLFNPSIPTMTLSLFQRFYLTHIVTVPTVLSDPHCRCSNISIRPTRTTTHPSLASASINVIRHFAVSVYCTLSKLNPYR
jgi:hypothetical protein